MKHLLCALCLAASAICAPAFASSEYQFSYTFSSPPTGDSYSNQPANPATVTGTFWGTASGDLITGISGLLISYVQNGVSASNLPVELTSYSGQAAGAVVSFSGAGNDFLCNASAWGVQFFSFISQGKDSGAATDLFWFQKGPAWDSSFYIATDFVADPASWSVVAVPEPETYALMGLGLLGLCAAKRRRVSAPAAAQGDGGVQQS